MLLASSCKREELQQTPSHAGGGGPYCTMRSVVQTSGGCKDSSFIGYDSEGRIGTVIRYNYCMSGGTGQPLVSRKWFIYDGGKVFILDTSFMANKDTVTVDAVLRIVAHHRTSGSTGSSIVGQYRYSPAGLLQSSVVQYSGMPAFDTTTYSFANGDLREAAGKSGTTSYLYYDKRYVPTNGFVTQNGLAYGSAFFYRNVHLLKATLDEAGNTTAGYDYTFDNSGNITSKIATLTGSPIPDTTSYSYMCAVE